MSSDINLLLEKATSPLLLDIDWDTTLHIVDLIRQGDVNPKAAVQSLVSRLKDSNPNVVLLALEVFESVVKNCGQSVHEQVACWAVMEQIHDVLRINPSVDVRKKILLLLSTWVYAFRNEPKYRAVQDTINIMKAEGYQLPTFNESDAMFTAYRAPDWADGECCHGCRTQFTMLKRKHHCRACGQVFCGDCSSKSSTIPKFGIEREVRVCESCYDDINNPRRPLPSVEKVNSEEPTSCKKSKTPGKKSKEELQEEKELQLAIALSQSEAKNKEKVIDGDDPGVLPESGRCNLETDEPVEPLPSISKASPHSKADGKLDTKITDTILYMVCKDGLPLSAIESEGLKLLLKTTAPLYQVPGRKKLTSLLEKKDISLREVVKQQLTQAVWVSITTDLASVTPKGYLVVTGHFIESGYPRNVCLGVAELTPTHTGEHLANDLTFVLDSWNLETRKICSITTDGGANIIGAVRKIMGGERSHVPCMAHLINLCVHQALSKSEKVTSVIEKVKLIVAYFQRNISASDVLHAAQYKTGVLVPLELIQAVYTRWNSTFYSLERFTQLARCVSQVLLSGCHRTAPAMLTTEELAIVTDLVVVLSPFEDATNEVSGDKYMTASTVLPIVNCLHNTVAEASFVNEDIMALNDALLDQIVWRLLPLEDNYLLASATILDPRFKMVHFRSPMRSSKVLQWISREMRAVVNGNPYEDSNTQQRKVERPCVFGSLWNIHDRLTKQEAAAVELPGSSDELHPELKLYLKMPKVDRTQCPLKLWLDLEKSFPILARLAFKYLTVMGSSVASDSVVSHLNTTASDVRNRLSPAHINMLVFMSSLDYNTWFSEI